MEKLCDLETTEGLSAEKVALLAKFKSVAATYRRRTNQEPVFLLQHIEAIIKDNDTN